jgi:photosystem II stability/assembly factor-like uncharacterized protein
LTTIVAIGLIGVVLALLAYPLFVESRVPLRSVRGRGIIDLEEAYRAALADLQDLQTDWEAGSVAQSDYDTLRERYRTRAAEALRSLAVQEEEVASFLARVEQASTGPSPARSASAVRSPEVRRRASTRSAGAGRRVSRRSFPVPVLIAGTLVVLAVGGIIGLYLGQVGAQSAQASVAKLELDHAHAVLIDPSGELWVGHHDGLVRSQDGRIWSSTGLRNDVMAVVLMNPDRRLLLGHDAVLAWGGDGRGTALSHDLPGTDVHGADLGFGGVVAYVVGFGVFRSVDGEHWEPFAAPVPQGVSGLAVLPAPGGDVLFLAVGGTVARSVDGGRTWSAAAGAAGLALGGSTRAIATDRETGSLYAASSDGVFRSRNMGADWTKLPYRGSAGAVGARGQQVVVVDDEGRVFSSGDGGATWPGGR